VAIATTKTRTPQTSNPKRECSRFNEIIKIIIKLFKKNKIRAKNTSILINMSSTGLIDSVLSLPFYQNVTAATVLDSGGGGNARNESLTYTTTLTTNNGTTFGGVTVVNLTTTLVSPTGTDFGVYGNELSNEPQKEFIFDRLDVRIIFITLYSLVFCCCFFGKYMSKKVKLGKWEVFFSNFTFE
jgi:hypothetical protein